MNTAHIRSLLSKAQRAVSQYEAAQDRGHGENAAIAASELAAHLRAAMSAAQSSRSHNAVPDKQNSAQVKSKPLTAREKADAYFNGLE